MLSTPCTAFSGSQRLATGPLSEVALVVRAAAGIASHPILIFDDVSGKAFDIDTRGSDEDVLLRLSQLSERSPQHAPEPAPPPAAAEPAAKPAPRGKGRPRLGVVAREITLLPRHWEWLGSQPGGASVALRKLVEEARRCQADEDRARNARDAAYHFMSAIAGNLPGFEEAVRALYAGDRARLESLTAGWPADVRDHAVQLAFGRGAGAR